MNTSNNFKTWLTIGVVALSFASTQAPAAEGQDRWRISLVPYIWLPAVDTQVSVNGGPPGGDSSTSSFDVFDALEMALMGTVEAGYGRFSVIFDFQYVRLGDEFSTNLPSGSVLKSDYDLTLATGSAGVGYRFVDEEKISLDGLVGARVVYTGFEADLDDSSGASFSAEEDVTLVDPVIGGRASWHFAPKWSLTGYGDIGGFGVGSDLTWQALGSIDYRFNEHFELRVGYRAFALDFDEDDLKLDIVLHGPIIALGITF